MVYTHTFTQKVNCLMEKLQMFQSIVRFIQLQTRLVDILFSKKDVQMFQSIVRVMKLQTKLVGIVFNKMDEFEEKLKESHLVKYFPDYTGKEFGI